jgi:hypothetical protein
MAPGSSRAARPSSLRSSAPPSLASLPPGAVEAADRQPGAGKEPHMTIATDAAEFLVDIVTQLFHADVLITEQAERIEALEVEVERLQAVLAEAAGATA